MARPIFISVRAQEGNLGDLVIRRYVVDIAKEANAEIHVLAGDVPQGFRDALKLPADTHSYESTASWIAALTRLTIRRSVVLAFTPGPQTLSLRPREATHLIMNALLTIFVRLTGGEIVKVGRSISGDSGIGRRLERVVVKFSSMYSVRDEASATLLGLPDCAIAPDVAFGADVDGFLDDTGIRAPRESRPYLAMTFRGDRPIDRTALSQLVTRARTSGLQPILVTQVRHDAQLHKELATSLDVECIWWDRNISHGEQLKRVLSIYRRSQGVVSNRLHGIIFGVQCGAAPVGWPVVGDQKLYKTLSPLGMADCIHHDSCMKTIIENLDVTYAQQVENARLWATSNAYELRTIIERSERR